MSAMRVGAQCIMIGRSKRVTISSPVMDRSTSGTPLGAAARPVARTRIADEPPRGPAGSLPGAA